MNSRGESREHRPARPLSNRAIALGAVIVLGIGAVAWTVLLWRYGGADPGVELDAIRTAGTLIVGAGGAAALLLAARRQRSTELTLEHQREVAAATERDAAEQRLTELYTRAVDQLGNGQAPVRLGGLHALERLAQNNPDQRQTIVDVICAYLRMPYTPPGDQAPGEDAHRRYEQQRQELQVRLTAQRILAAHLRPEVKAAFWVDIDLNLTEAHLYQLDLSYCHVHTARFDGATFTKTARFEGAKFAGGARFDGATFTKAAEFGMANFAGGVRFAGAEFAGNASFEDAWFAGDVRFEDAEFAGYARFDRAEFAGYARFDRAKFAVEGAFLRVKFAYARFEEANFAGDAWFGKAAFSQGAGFEGASFAGYARFDRASFAGNARFDRASFAGNARFDGAEFAWGAEFDGACVSLNSPHVALPRGWTTRAAQLAEGEEEGWLYVVRDEESSEQPTEANDGDSEQV